MNKADVKIVKNTKLDFFFWFFWLVNKFKYFILIKNIDIDPRWDKASISKINNEKKENEKIKLNMIFWFFLIFLKIPRNDINAKKFISDKKTLKIKFNKKMSIFFKYRNSDKK